MGLRRFDRDVGLVLVAVVLFLAVENLAIGVGYRAEFVAAWEMGSAQLYLSPIALALAVPVACFVVGLARLAASGRAGGVGFVVGCLGGLLGWGVSTGRHFAKLAVRAPFAVVVGLAFGAVAWALGRRLPRARPVIVALLGLGLAIAAWLADAFVLPRLYPAFHWALLVLVLVGVAATTLVVRGARVVAAFGLVIASASIAWSPHAATMVRGADNLRRVLLERAPALGPAVVVASRLAPPPPLEDDDGAATTTLTSLRDRKGGGSLDWRGRDLVVVTIDALRADHLGAYGYQRPTSPNIDALARRGVRFEHAYCPTPHTSYSIASMMTGKYMKPLLALGGEDDSETWAVQLRRYGYRTAAFYPPAVFFIDEHRFRRLENESLGFEYKKEEFAAPPLRREQIASYLTTAPHDKPLFLWVHLFEPHEPYEMHAEHPFSGDPAFDAYDSEIAEADALVGDIVRLVSEKRPDRRPVFVVSADHGEEHGDHGGRYHGTTVYEEQVRVPLIVVDEPRLAPRVVEQPVQTIDLLPTSLSALDVPQPPRLRGRDLTPMLLGGDRPNDEGLAFAETDDYTLVARGTDRLVCARKIGSCTLFDLACDPTEKHALADRPARVTELRKLTAAIERETGKVEANALPEALRRGLQGDRDAAEDVTPLLDDVRVDIRRAAAHCAFGLRAPEMAPQLERALAQDEDAEVRHWSALALVRLGRLDPKAAPLDGLLGDAQLGLPAALAFAERGDARGEAQLVARWNAAFVPDAATAAGELDEARDLLGAFAKLRSKLAVPGLVRALPDVRLRPHITPALGEIGDVRARAPLAKAFAEERYVHLRPLEARALLRLGARAEVLGPLMRFAGAPDPMLEAIAIAREGDLLRPENGGKQWPEPAATAGVSVRVPDGPARLLVLADAPRIEGAIGGATFTLIGPPRDRVFFVDVPAPRPRGKVDVRIDTPVSAIWVVPHAEEIPPPPPTLSP